MDMPSSEATSPGRIMELSSAFYGSSVLFAASDAGVFACLSAQPDSGLEEVADAVGGDLRAVRLLLDGCVAIGLLEKHDSGYRNRPDVEAFLVPGHPGSLHDAIRYNRDVYSAWGKLPGFVASGQPVEAPELHLGADADRTLAFVLAMHERAMAIGRALIPAVDLSGCRSILDIGGGPGAYAVLAARSNPEVNVTVIDLPGVTEIAETLVAQAGMTSRISFLPGSYHETDFPAEQDAVHWFGVLHQESETSIPGLLARSFEALRPGGRIHVMDMMTDATRTQPAFSALFALNMALTTEHGWVFSDEDMKQWLAEAGFERIDVKPLPPPMPHWLVSARRPGA